MGVPPLIEGGLARHVSKLAENLAAQGVDVHVIAGGREEDPAEEESGGVVIHRVREPRRPRELGEFVAWIEHMNSDMPAVGVELGDRWDFDVVHGHDWLVASAGDHLASAFATLRGDHPRHRARAPPGLGRQAPAVLHPRRRDLDGQPRRARDHLLGLHARARGRRLRPRGVARGGDPQRHRPFGAGAGGRPRRAPRALCGARREAGAARRPARVREGISTGARGPARADREGRQRALHRRRLGHRRAGAARAGVPARPRRGRNVLGLDRRRRVALALPHRRPHGRAVDLRAVWPGRARGHGLRLPVPGGRHGRAAGGRAERGRGPALSLARPPLACHDGRAAAADEQLRDRLVAEANEPC